MVSFRQCRNQTLIGQVSKLEERSQQLSVFRGPIEHGVPQGQAGGNITFRGYMVVFLRVFFQNRESLLEGNLSTW